LHGAGTGHAQQRAHHLQIRVLGHAVLDVEGGGQFAEVGFLAGRLLQAVELALADAADGAWQVEADDGAVSEGEVGAAIQSLDELELACAVGGELQADLGLARQPGDVGGVLQEWQGGNVVEREVGADCRRLAGAVDVEQAFAVTVVELHIVEGGL